MLLWLVSKASSTRGDNEVLGANSVGWTGPQGGGDSSLKLQAGTSGARLLLYAGQPQNISVVAQGPFIAGTREALAGYYDAYRQGRFPHAGKMRPLTLQGRRNRLDGPGRSAKRRYLQNVARSPLVQTIQRRNR
ncbi:pirin-like C-terminal cupin domain-containing protein [Massilia sp. CFBP9012]|uniref:pirin-like C-terminal cupin domain-containing protein n=1 Tax=Massilia sp. CFBP9012 TaxID=3096531 RepID=UPI0039C90672